MTVTYEDGVTVTNDYIHFTQEKAIEILREYAEAHGVKVGRETSLSGVTAEHVSCGHRVFRSPHRADGGVTLGWDDCVKENTQ